MEGHGRGILRARRIPAVCLGALLPLSSCVTTRPATPADAASEILAAERLGRAQAAALLQTNVRLIAPGLRARLQKIADEICEAAERDQGCEIHILNSPQMNMLTLPSGDIFVFSGFLEGMENRDELAFALAHEIAHLQRDHGLNSIKHAFRVQSQALVVGIIMHSLLTAAAVGAAGAGVDAIPFVQAYAGSGEVILRPAAAAIGRLTGKVTEAFVTRMVVSSIGSYSRANELEADQLGMTYATAAGYDPRGAVTLMEKFGTLHHVYEAGPANRK